jgi:hypothetical protein
MAYTIAPSTLRDVLAMFLPLAWLSLRFWTNRVAIPNHSILMQINYIDLIHRI